MDSYIKWVECWILNNTNASKLIDCSNSCFQWFGFPKILVGDNGPTFSSNEFHKYCKVHSIEVIQAPPFNTDSNVVADNGVQTMTTGLVKILSKEKDIKGM